MRMTPPGRITETVGAVRLPPNYGDVSEAGIYVATVLEFKSGIRILEIGQPVDKVGSKGRPWGRSVYRDESSSCFFDFINCLRRRRIGRGRHN
jgi:hypothetical protein